MNINDVDYAKISLNYLLLRSLYSPGQDVTTIVNFELFEHSYKIALLVFSLQHLKHQDIAHQLGLNLDTVKSISWIMC